MQLWAVFVFINSCRYAPSAHHQENYKLQMQPPVLAMSWDAYTGFTSSQLIQAPVATSAVYSSPDDGRKKRPKHVEHTCSC